jgi:N-hydroxyarylamine O-acetyltransferase
LQSSPELTLEGLREVYGAWCQHVPFDNVRKLIHIRSGDGHPLPGSNPEDFLRAWLKYGTGGTCWSGAGALHALLRSLGFDATRGIGTMIAAPDLPPNHGSVLVTFDTDPYLVDSSILHGEPLALQTDAETRIEHSAWGVCATRKEGLWHVWWRPLHKVDGFECRFEHFNGTAGEFEARHEQTRGWSPFNFELSARLNRNDEVIGVAFGKAVSIHRDGSVTQTPITHPQRRQLLIEQLGISEEIVRLLPEDIPTPHPPKKPMK